MMVDPVIFLDEPSDLFFVDFIHLQNSIPRRNSNRGAHVRMSGNGVASLWIVGRQNDTHVVISIALAL